MANVTDPLALAVSGSDPQNLLEYITRQRIYDSRFWKERCFGQNAEGVLELAVETLQCVGGTFGGNAQPTKFLCLTLKLLQLQPLEEVTMELLQQEEFKYVRCLAALYLRLTGRPATIYQQLEECGLTDYRKLRFRMAGDWELTTVDQFMQQLLTEDRVCGIALPRLPARSLLEEEGHLDGPYTSPLQASITQHGNGSLEEYLKYKALSSPAAQMLWKARQERRAAKEAAQRELEQRKRKLLEQRRGGRPIDRKLVREDDPRFDRVGGSRTDRHRETMSGRQDRRDGKDDGEDLPRARKRRHDDDIDEDENRVSSRHESAATGMSNARSREEKKRRKDKKKTRKKDKNYGSLFKSSSSSKRPRTESPTNDSGKDADDEHDDNDARKESENSEEYWDEQRAKLGMAPLRK